MKLFKTSLVLFFLVPAMMSHAQDEISMVVGTYTNGESKGIYSYSFNQSTGLCKPLDTLEISNPSFLTLSSDGKVIYAVSENSNDKATVSAVNFDSATGKMSLLNSQPTKASGPCHVATNDNFLLTANYDGGSISMFPLKVDGFIEPLKAQFMGSTGGTFMPNQSAAHVHTNVFTPDGDYVLSTDFSADRILRFRISGMEDLQPDGVAGTVAPGSGPRHITFSTDSRFFYVMSELAGTVTVFSWYNGKARKIQQIASDSVGGHGGADIHVAPNGKFLYASNRLKSDGISIFRIDQRTGKLTKTGYQLTGKHPRNFAITPNGKYLLCACRDEGKIQVFEINPSNGMLNDTHKDIAIDKAVCIQFYPAVMQPGFGNGQFKVIEKTVSPKS